MTHQLAKGRTATLIKLAFAAGAKSTAAFAAFTLTALVTRNMPNDEAGLFLLGFTLLTVLSILFRFGLDNVILRFLSAHGTDDASQEKLNRGLLWITTTTIPATIIGMVLSEPIATHVFNKPNFAPILFWMLPALPAMALFFLLSFAFQAQHRVVLTTFFQNLGISLLFILVFGYLWFKHPEVISAVSAAQVYTVAAIVIFSLATILWFGQEDKKFGFRGYSDKELFEASKNLWIAAVMGLSIQWAGIILSGVYLSAEDVALLSAAQRAALLITFVIMVVNMVMAPRFASLWSDGNVAKIRHLAKLSTRGMLLIAFPIALMMMLWPIEVMELFGEGFSQGDVLLQILVVGQFVNVLTGSVGYLLNMTGHEQVYRQITVVIGVLSLFACFLIIPEFGAKGAAFAITSSAILTNICCVIAVRVKLGFWTIG